MLYLIYISGLLIKLIYCTLMCVYVRIIKMYKSQYFLLSYETRFLKYFVYVNRKRERREI